MPAMNLQKKLTPFIAMAIIACCGPLKATDSKFRGNWSYKQTCGRQHSASIHFIEKGSEVSGDWEDGSAKGQYSEGQLKGNIKGEKLFVSYCSIDENSGHSICPSYDAKETDYFIRKGETIIWFRMTGKRQENKFKKYITLYPEVNGKPSIIDRQCIDE